MNAISPMIINIVLCFAAPILPRSAKYILYALLLATNFFGLFSYLKANRGFTKKDNPLAFDMLKHGAIMLVYSVFNIAINGISIDSFERLLQLFICFSILLNATFHSWTQHDKKSILLMIKAIIVISMAYWLLNGIRFSGFASVFTNSNGFACASFMYFVLFHILGLNEKKNVIYLLFLLFFVMISNCRAVILAMIVYGLLYWLMKKHPSNKWKYLFVIVIAVICMIPLVYIGLYQSEYRRTLNDFFNAHTGKNLFSKRQILWIIILEKCKERPLFGFGFGVAPESLIGGNWSAHNWYIQTLLQVGVVGTVLLLTWISTIWKLLVDKLNKSSIGPAFVVAVMIWQCFEVTLTQNNIFYGIMVWLIWGMLASDTSDMSDTVFTQYKNDNNCRENMIDG